VVMLLRPQLRPNAPVYAVVDDEREGQHLAMATGWKLLHGDVFRPPARLPELLAVCVGVGAQLIGTAAVSITVGCFGWLLPAHPGNQVIVPLVAWLLMGVVGGYVTARVYKLFNGASWQWVASYTAFGLPTMVFTALLLLDVAVWTQRSTNAVRLSSIVAVLSMWLCVGVPLTYVGARFGWRTSPFQPPVRVSAMPRGIVTQPLCSRTAIVVAVGGVLPFGALFVELFFVLSALWLDTYYYTFGVLFLVLMLTLLTCAEIASIAVYYQLEAGDYRWWWRALQAPAGAGLFLFVYCVQYADTRLDMPYAVPRLVYYVTMGLVAVAVSLMAGAAGFGASLWFVVKLYSTAHVSDTVSANVLRECAPHSHTATPAAHAGSSCGAGSPCCRCHSCRRAASRATGR